MTMISITKARVMLCKLIDILQSGSISETSHLLSIPGMKESIQKGMKEDTESCADAIDL